MYRAVCALFCGITWVILVDGILAIFYGPDFQEAPYWAMLLAAVPATMVSVGIMRKLMKKVEP